MKLKTATLFLLLALLPVLGYCQPCQTGTAQVDLDVNNVKARLLAGADLWWDRSDGKYIVPKPQPGQPEVASIFAGGLWIGGVDPGGNQKISASTYGAAFNQVDFWPGPLMTGIGITDDATCSNFDRLWKINREDIDAHIADFLDNNVINGPVPPSVLAWPGQGNPQSMAANGFVLPNQPLAPFEDRNGNGIYEPLAGDYPKVPGDQAVWWVFNDDGAGAIHGETDGIAIRVEIHALAYAYAGENDPNLFNTTFYDFTIYNRAVEDILDTYVTLWVDAHLGCYADDYIGCDPDSKMAYVYNSDAVDGNPDCTCEFGIPTYCEEIPMLGIKVISGPKNSAGEDAGFSSFMYYNDVPIAGYPTATNDPDIYWEFYNYMRGRWRDGSPLTVGEYGYQQGGGGIPTSYAFPDNPSQFSEPGNWTLCSANLLPFHRRLLINSGPFNLQPGEKTSVCYAVMSLLDVPHPCPDVTPLIEMGNAIQDFCESLSADEEAQKEQSRISIFPNPMSLESKLVLSDNHQWIEEISLFSADGKLLRSWNNLDVREWTLERNELPSGMYFLKVLTNKGFWNVSKVVVR